MKGGSPTYWKNRKPHISCTRDCFNRRTYWADVVVFGRQLGTQFYGYYPSNTDTPRLSRTRVRTRQHYVTEHPKPWRNNGTHTIARVCPYIEISLHGEHPRGAPAVMYWQKQVWKAGAVSYPGVKHSPTLLNMYKVLSVRFGFPDSHVSHTGDHSYQLPLPIPVFPDHAPLREDTFPEAAPIMDPQTVFTQPTLQRHNSNAPRSYGWGSVAPGASPFTTAFPSSDPSFYRQPIS